MRTNYIVGVYLVDKAYGGPEEGGWWYNTGELCRTLRVFHTEEAAISYAKRLQDKLNVFLNKGRREISSVLSTGRYYAEIHDNVLPEHYPAVRPHYE